MAIQINVKSDNGVVLGYHHIAAINTEINQRVTVIVESYIDSEGRQYDKDYRDGKIVGEPTFPYTTAEYYGLDWEEALPLLKGDVIKNMYDWIKQQPMYLGAVDV